MREASCAICSYTRTLTSHHIHPKQFRDSYPGGPDAIDEWANLVILCQGCHSAVHDKRSYQQLIRDLKTKMRRKPRIKDDKDDNSIRQSLKDQAVQYAVWERMLDILSDKHLCERIENYRRIIRIVTRVHESWYIDGEEAA